MGVEWAIVAAIGLTAAVAVLGYLAARPAVTLERDRRKLAEEQRDEAKQALVEAGKQAEQRRRGAQVDADHAAAVDRELASAPGDPMAAARAVVRLARQREEALAAAAGEAGRTEGDLGAGGGLAGGGPGGPDRGGAGARAPVV